METMQQSEPSSKDDPIPKMKADHTGHSVGKVLYDSGDSFKRFMGSHVKELIKKMRSEKVISKPFTKWIKNEQDSQIDKLLSEMKKMKPDKFVNYLKLLLSIVTEEEKDSEKSESEKTKESDGAVQRSLKDDTKEMMRIMRGSLEAMKPVPGSELDIAVSRIAFLVDQDSGTVIGQTTISDQVQVDHSSPLTSCEISESEKTKESDGDIQKSLKDNMKEVSESEKTKESDGDIQKSLKDNMKEVSESEKTKESDDDIQKSLKDNMKEVSESEKTKESDGDIQKSLKDNTKEMMQIPKGSLIDQDVRQKTISDQVQVDHSSPLTSSARPPGGQLGDSVSGVFTNEGGILYSPLHGVTVIIPPHAIPEATPKFFLSMHFYLLDPFTLEDDVELCSVIVWFHQSPQFHFLKDVTVKIPHAAIVDDTNDDSLCVLTNKQFKLNTKIPADFSDGYHAVFKVKHFCAKTIGRAKKRRSARNSRRKKLQRMGSSSIEKSFEEGMASRSNSTESGPSSRTPLRHQEAMDTDSPVSAVSQDSTGEEEVSDTKYSIVCGMPRDRSKRNWDVLFAASYDIYCRNQELVKLVQKKFGEDVYHHLVSCVRIRGGYFELCKESLWSDDNWDIESPVSPPEISVESIEIPDMLSPNYPPRVSFEVSSSREFDHPQLRCRIEAQGAQTKSGKTISFLIKSTPPPAGNNDDRVLQTARYLYGDDSDIIRALTSADIDLKLNILKSDHRKFLADISLQISDKQRLCQVLDRHYDDRLDTYIILSDWVATPTNYATIARLKERLRTMKIVDIRVCENETQHQLLSQHLEEEYVFMRWSDSPVLRGDLSQKLQCCWRSVGRLLGISENDLEIERQRNELDSYSYHMINAWQRREGRGATFGTLFKAIHRACVHDPTHILDAHQFSIYYVENYF